MTLREYIEGAGYKMIDDAYYKKIDLWEAWYRGRVDSFHRYQIYNAGKRQPRDRATLNMAKGGSEYWADLLWNSECAVNLKNSEDDKLVNRVLADNDFTRRFCGLVERAWALGTGACVVYPGADKSTVIDYVSGRYIFPVAWRGDRVDSCVFAARYRENKADMLYLMIHERQPDGGYMISNKYFKVAEGEQITETPAPEGVQEEYSARACRFAIVRPAIENNAAPVPLGMSIYGNHIDTLKSIDLAYDGMKTAMEIGRPRIGVSHNLVKIDEKTGAQIPLFDATDIAVYDLGTGQMDDPVKVEDLTTQYRATEFESSLQAQLNVYSQRIGLGEQAFRWNRAAGDVARTATEVISGNSAMTRAMRKHQDGLRGAITQLVRAILDINGCDANQEIAIVFDDSVVRDKGAEALEAWQWVVLGRMSFEDYLIRYKGYDAKEAAEIVANAQAGQGQLPDEE